MATRTFRSAPDDTAWLRRPDGFTLLEVLAAIVVLATALVALLSLHARNIRTVTYDLNLTRATLLAQHVMTRTITAEPFPEPAESNGRFESDPEFAWHVTIARSANSDLEDRIREIRVQVYWDPAQPNAAELVTFVRRPDS